MTHALQQPGALGVSTGGRGEYVRSLARVGISQGIAAVFIETHPEPSRARCDGACALPLNEMREVLSELAARSAHQELGLTELLLFPFYTIETITRLLSAEAVLHNITREEVPNAEL